MTPCVLLFSYDPLSIALPDQAVWHNAGAIIIALQLLPLSPMDFQLRILSFVYQHSVDRPRNQALCAAVHIVSALVDSYRSVILDADDVSVELRPLLLRMIRSFAGFSCSGNDIRALVALLNDSNWEVCFFSPSMSAFCIYVPYFFHSIHTGGVGLVN